MRLRTLTTTGLLMIGLLSGCGGSKGPPLGQVTGKVIIDNSPVTDARVIFVPEGKGSPSYGGTDKNGVYRLMFSQHRLGAEVGVHSVLIESREPKTDDSGNVVNPSPVIAVPVKYSRPGALSAKVNLGRNSVDFVLDKADEQSL